MKNIEFTFSAHLFVCRCIPISTWLNKISIIICFCDMKSTMFKITALLCLTINLIKLNE